MQHSGMSSEKFKKHGKRANDIYYTSLRRLSKSIDNRNLELADWNVLFYTLIDLGNYYKSGILLLFLGISKESKYTKFMKGWDYMLQQ